MRARTALVCVGIGTCLGVGGGAALASALPRAPLAEGLFVGGEPVPEGASPGAWLAGRRNAELGKVVRLRQGTRVFRRTLGELGVEVDPEATLAEAELFGHRGSLARRIGEGRRARRGEIDVPLVYRVDSERLASALSARGKEIGREPVDARLDLAARKRHPDVPGLELDVPATARAVGAARRVEGEVVDLVTREVPAKVLESDLARVDVSKVLASAESTFVTWGEGAGRARNVENAARLLDGAVVGPGQVLSFNERVGPRTRARGFALAPEIQGDEMTTGIGGGTCQVSTMLHIAVLFGALDVIERQSHSRPSSYAKLGLDATVVYPKVDLKVRNTLPFPILVHAYLPMPTSVRVELLGGDPVAEVRYRYGVARAEDFVRRITVRKGLAPGKRVRKQKGSRGLDVTSFVEILYPDGRRAERRYFSGYRPAPEVFWVAPGYDESELPPLPEHARGVEGRERPSDPLGEQIYAM